MCRGDTANLARRVTGLRLVHGGQALCGRNVRDREFSVHVLKASVVMRPGRNQPPLTATVANIWRAVDVRAMSRVHTTDCVVRMMFETPNKYVPMTCKRDRIIL